jgi:hypothetical protein
MMMAMVLTTTTMTTTMMQVLSQVPPPLQIDQEQPRSSFDQEFAILINRLWHSLY